METPNLDNLINDLKAYDRNDMLSDAGRSQLNEYEAIKRVLSNPNVVGQSEQSCQYEPDDTTSMNCKHCGNPKWTHDCCKLA